LTELPPRVEPIRGGEPVIGSVERQQIRFTRRSAGASASAWRLVKRTRTRRSPRGVPSMRSIRIVPSFEVR